MKLYSENKEYKLYHGNMLDMLDEIEENSIDSIVTDPPYELGFMGKDWDRSGIAYQKETWEKCLRVLKPGGHMVVFGGSRTHHRVACAIEDAGFEIRDCIMYLYGSGMPKSLNIGLAIDKKNGIDNRTGNLIKGQGVKDNSKNVMHLNCNEQYEERIAQNEWNGWGTQLKPAYEAIILARKPVESTIVDNVLKYGVGGLNIDECRLESIGKRQGVISFDDKPSGTGNTLMGSSKNRQIEYDKENKGRFPANIIHDGSEDAISGMPITKGTDNIRHNNQSQFSGKGIYGKYNDYITVGYADEGSASRYFYCAKASPLDRNEGLVDSRNIHSTVKPVELMEYLVKLVTPKNGTILDPFNGSGSTGKAVMWQNKTRDANYKYIGIELNEEYLAISKDRIEYISNNTMDFILNAREQSETEKAKIEKEKSKYLDLFGGIDDK